MKAVQALLLLATAGLVAGDLVATDTYKCDPNTCKPPACLCASNNPPGGLFPQQVPQFVLISHANALNVEELGPGLDGKGWPASWVTMDNIVGGKKNKNGCPVPVTWFAQRYHSQCAAGDLARQNFHEIAMQNNRYQVYWPFNFTDPNPNYNTDVGGKPSIQKEITMSREWWNEACGYPMKDISGFQAIQYVTNTHSREVLGTQGYLYDATLIENYASYSPSSPAPNKMVWPFTADAGIPLDCGFYGPPIAEACPPTEKHPGLWVVPQYQMQCGEGCFYGIAGYGDPELGAKPIKNLTDFFINQFDARYKGGRAPFQINTYVEWLAKEPGNAQAVKDFIDYALKQPDTYFITYSDLVAWMQKPGTKDKADSFFTCTTYGNRADLSGIVNQTIINTAGTAPVPTGPEGAPPAVTPAGAPAPAAVTPAPAATPAALPSAAPIPTATPMPAPVPVPTPVVPAPAPAMEPVMSSPSPAPVVPVVPVPVPSPAGTPVPAAAPAAEPPAAVAPTTSGAVALGAGASLAAAALLAMALL